MNSTTKSIRRPDNHARPAEERARAHLHVYYPVTGETLEVLAIWHGARGEGPTLG